MEKFSLSGYTAAEKNSPEELRSSLERSRGKLASKPDLDALFKEFDLLSEVPSVASLSIDTTHNSPQKVTTMIAHHYRLVESKSVTSCVQCK